LKRIIQFWVKNAIYTKTSKITHLPQYVCINFVRFFWKSKEQIKSKVLKDIKFPITLDLHEYCHDDLKKVLNPNREILKKRREREIKSKLNEKEEEIIEDIKEVKDGNPSGYYELCGVVTHKGRSAESGHYVGWVKESDGRWIMYDDDVVGQVSEEDVKKLSGGGDWHTAYMLFYRSKKSNGEYVGIN